MLKALESSTDIKCFTKVVPAMMRFARSIFGYFVLGLLVLASVDVPLVAGRKCVCTSKACKEAGVSTCKTKFSCYTELIMNGEKETAENATTRGCTEGATPLLCETKSWTARSKSSDTAAVPPSAPWVRMAWPRLKCCDSQDYCNADKHVNVSTWIQESEKAHLSEPNADNNGSSQVSSELGTVGPIQVGPGTIIVGQASPDQLLQHRVRPLHLAAVILAIAALISVLAACYVITRFLRSNPYMAGNVE